MQLPDQIYTEIVKHTEEFPGREICGLVVQNKDYTVEYVKCANINIDPISNFTIKPSDFAEAEDKYWRILAIVHNHPENSKTFSPADVTMCNNGYMPWILYTRGAFQTLYPDNFESLIGKEFKLPEYDCYELAREYYKLFQDIVLPPAKDREDMWWNKHDYIVEQYKDAGFFVVEGGIKDLQVGDGLLMKIHTANIGHIAVYVGEGQILHAAHGKLSTVEMYIGLYQRGTKLIVRHNANNYKA